MGGVPMTLRATALFVALMAVMGTSERSLAERWQDWFAIENGMIVEVHGEKLDHRGLKAKKIYIRNGGDPTEFEIAAVLESVEPGGTEFTLLGIPVRVGKNCETETELRRGAWIEVDGHIEGGAVLEADRIRSLPGTTENIEIEGSVKYFSRKKKTMVVNGLSIRLDGDPVVRGPGGAKVSRRLFLPRNIDDDGARPGSWRSRDGRFVIGGGLQSDLEPEMNYNLNGDRPGDLIQSKWIAEMEVDARVLPGLDGFLKVGHISKRIHLDEESDESNTSEYSLKQLYFVWQPTSMRNVALQVGRQDFDESREWIYDENLDGVRFHSLIGSIQTEISYTIRWNTDSKRLKDWRNAIVAARVPVREKWDIGSYAIRRTRDGDAGNRAVWYGFRSEGKLGGPLHHWADLSLLRGKLDGIRRSAYGVDAGLRLRVTRKHRLSLTAGWAYGSGGSEEKDRYRQTGLQDNNDKFGGVASFKYYGELFEPELSNLKIATMGVGFRPSRKSSIDLIFHDYRQVEPDRSLIRSNLEAKPLGKRDELGREWDLILAFEEIPRVDVEYSFSVFDPGAAFPEIAETARSHKLQVEYNF